MAQVSKITEYSSRDILVKKVNCADTIFLILAGLTVDDGDPTRRLGRPRHGDVSTGLTRAWRDTTWYLAYVCIIDEPWDRTDFPSG